MQKNIVMYKVIILRDLNKSLDPCFKKVFFNTFEEVIAFLLLTVVDLPFNGCDETDFEVYMNNLEHPQFEKFSKSFILHNMQEMLVEAQQNYENLITLK